MGQWRELSEMLAGCGRRRVLCSLHQGYHLLRASGETAGCWQREQLEEKQGTVIIAVL